MEMQIKIQWRKEKCDGTIFYEANSPYRCGGIPILWRLLPVMQDGLICGWKEGHDLELLPKKKKHKQWDTLKEAKQAIIKDHKQILKDEKRVSEALNLSLTTESLKQIITDPENQPHQYQLVCHQLK